VHGLAPQKGLIVPGADADLVVWDPELELTITHANRHNGNDYTPYEGLPLVGGPARVYVRGELAFQDGEVVAPPGSGRFVRRAREASPHVVAA
jgi:dihydropyrimidinase